MQIIKRFHFVLNVDIKPTLIYMISSDNDKYIPLKYSIAFVYISTHSYIHKQMLIQVMFVNYNIAYITHKARYMVCLKHEYFYQKDKNK